MTVLKNIAKDRILQITVIITVVSLFLPDRGLRTLTSIHYGLLPRC
ncbi:hypothetical protein HYQ54_0119 [Lactobacillus crispatus]|nr:hypothetical protein [Lactobacillus crispatus]MBI1713623.1 hypothetical protein [Lactobacillus crispatus]